MDWNKFKGNDFYSTFNKTIPFNHEVDFDGLVLF